MAQFECISCGYGSGSWYGKCPQCGEFNTLKEVQKGDEPGKKTVLQKAKFVSLASVKGLSVKRKKTAFSEMDRVLGGGLVAQEVILLAGEPGVGKSTLLLKTLSNLRTAYVSGEESGEQVKERAERLHVDLTHLFFSNENQVEGIISTLSDMDDLDVVVIDSIQTVYSKDIASSVGSATQLKEVSARLIDFAKTKQIALILIGHVTKEGEIAGPKTLEHLVDCVLYFEGEKVSPYRILRAHKNRFGPTDEVGMFEMGELGLMEVKNPTTFIENTQEEVGKATVGIIEGTRPLFFEVQALAVSTSLPMPRRVVKGVDYNKVQLLLAVIRKNLHLNLDQYDIYINVVGGISIKSTAVDLGVVAAVVSSVKNVPLPVKSVLTGEIGLLGEVRKVMYQNKIIKESERFGLTKVYSPENIKSVKDLMKIFRV